ncbi:MAG: hypothetical protein BroJett003_03540 [Planctomycetota bacterium]|nr:MAG: hypothetical protein BroJett003_03540 [Planctomycetota bacterium]
MVETDPGSQDRRVGNRKPAPPIFPIPCGIGVKAINPSRRSRKPADRKQYSILERVSRTGVTQEGWFSISG